MPKTNVRFFISKDGMLFIDDISPLEANILKELGIKMMGNLKNSSVSFKKPNYIALKNFRVPLPLPEGVNRLVDLHDSIISPLNSPFYKGGWRGLEKVSLNENAKNFISIFELKKIILNIYLKKCNLCGFKCNGNRAKAGKCPILMKARYNQYFVHMGEEKEIGRTLAIEMVGCNIHCKFCQKGKLIDSKIGRPVNKSLWKEIKDEYKAKGFNNISFLGGNPDQSISGIIDFLEHSPRWASQLPVIWHTNGYSTPDLYNILYGLIDLWIFDFKFFTDECAKHLCESPNYVDTAKTALKTICNLSSNAPVIVRHLILPGHWNCCQRPLIDWLIGIKSNIVLNPMHQYKPLWKITDKDGKLSRPIEMKDVALVKDYASNAGFIITE